MAIKDWSTTAASNTNAATGVNFDEGMAPSDVNNSARELMAQVAAMVADVYTGKGPYYADSGAADAYVLTADPAISAYSAGQVFAFTTSNANTGASTINVNGVGATAIKVRGAALAGGEIQANRVTLVGYNGTDFDLLTPADAYTDFLRLDGASTPTADIPLGSNKITGLADGAAATDAASYGQVILKDGTNAATGDIPMGSNKITGLANGTALTDASNLSQIQDSDTTYAAGTGTNTITATLSPAPAAYAAGQRFTIKPAATNTGAVTINLNSLGAKAIQVNGSALLGGEIVINIPFTIEYDGTQFQLMTPVLYGLTASGTTRFGSGAGSALTSGTDSTFLGVNAGNTVTSGDGNVYVGDNSDGAATGEHGVAVGASATLSGDRATAVGYNASASMTGASQGSVAVGNDSSASTASVALGGGSSAESGTVAIGTSSNADEDGIAIGRDAAATGVSFGGIAIGRGATSTGGLSIASASYPLTLDATSRSASTYLPVTINGTQYYIQLET